MPNRLLFVLLVCTVPMAADGQDRARFFRWAIQDAGALGKASLAELPGAASAATGLIISSRGIDPGSNDWIRTWTTGPVQAFLDRTNQLGGPAMTLYAAGAFAASFVAGGERMQDAAFTSLESVLYAGTLAYAVKYTLGRGRPEEGFDSDQFMPFSGRSSFPSGHTTAAFAVVTPWVLYYPNPVVKALFALPVGTALARMDRDKHWATDVLAGAALGVVTARFLTRRHLLDRPPSTSGPKLRVHPTGASLSYRF